MQLVSYIDSYMVDLRKPDIIASKVRYYCQQGQILLPARSDIIASKVRYYCQQGQIFIAYVKTF